MIRDGDRVLVCLSGGKDSLSLLHTLRQYQFVSKARGVRFSLGAVTVDPGSASYNPRPLIPYLAALGLPYFYEEQSEHSTHHTDLCLFFLSTFKMFFLILIFYRYILLFSIYFFQTFCQLMLMIINFPHL